MTAPEVLIVGGGPIGLTCSILLSRLGLTNRVVERRDGVHAAPQAHVVSARTMEIFRAAGIDDTDIRAAATPLVDLANVVWTHTLAGPELGRLRLATPERAAKMLAAGPEPFANISQHLLEPILLEEARKAGATVDFDHDWQAMEPDTDGVTSCVENRTSGAVETVHSRFLLGCDGATSRVRRAAGIEMTGPDHILTLLNVHLRADFRSLVADRPAVLYWNMDPGAPGVFIAHDIDSNWVYQLPCDPEAYPREGPDAATGRALVERAVGAPEPFEILSMETWVMTAQVADHYGKDPVFLVGDAAHRFPPTGGLGMNTGIADAFNLAWKLAAVRNGHAGTALLESYAAERRDVAQENTRASVSNFEKTLAIVRAIGLEPGLSAEETRARVRSIPEDPERRKRVQDAIDAQLEHFDITGLDLGYQYERGALVPDGTPPSAPENPMMDYLPSTRPGSRLPHAWVSRSGERISTLDLVDPCAPVLLTGPAGAPWGAAAKTHGVASYTIGEGGDLEDAEGTWAAQCEISAAGALLVRPDQHVAWRSAAAVEDAQGALADALAHVLPT